MACCKSQKKTHVYFLTKVLKFWNKATKNQFGKWLKHINVLEETLITYFFDTIRFASIFLIFSILKNVI